ncbi:MAG: T9SS type A sorting domain-containing protein [Bacteroidota bacterium]
MFSLKGLAASALCLLTCVTASLSAQDTTYDVDLVTITFVTRNLDANCQSEIVYRNLLNGDFDADDDGMEPPNSAFIIRIEDNDPSNGNILDGCGRFAFTIEPAPDGGVTGFTFGSGFIDAGDITPPAQFLTAEPNGPFLTPQLADVTINTLPTSVSRSYMVDGTTTMPITSTISMSLVNRLLIGGDIPRFSDACSDIDVTVTDRITEDDDCGDIIITRTFSATDASATCIDDGISSGVTEVTYDIVLQRPSGRNVVAPPEVVTYDCNDPSLVPGQRPDPSTTDYPFLNGPDGPIYLENPYGNVGAVFSDSEIFTTCANTYKFVRTWSVADWCEPENIRVFSQLVKVGDTRPPTITSPTQDLDFDGVPDIGPLRFSTNAPECGAFINTNTGGLQVTDGCSSVRTVEAFVLLDRDPENRVGPINVYAPNPVDRLTPFLPAGQHTLQYVATDDCGNETMEELDIIIEDRSGPVVIAEDAINVSLSSSGFAEVPATDIDRGSYDDCTDVTVEIAFANPSTLLSIGGFGPTITLTCIDVGAVPVILRVTDENGNENTRMSIINVVDNSAPLCVAPGSLSLSCTEADDILPEDINAFFLADPNGTINSFNELFGEPTSLDNCGNELINQQITSTINDCGTGLVTRTFEVTDARGFTSAPGCQQFIRIGGVREYTLAFPADASATCGDDPSFNDLEYTALGCDMVVASINVDTFFASSEECFKLRRTIEVINWCEYDGIGAYYNIPRDADNDGNFGETTYLHVFANGNTDALDDVAVLDRDANRNNNNSIRNLDPDDNNTGPFEVDGDGDGDTGYANSTSRGAFRYIQFIKVFDSTAPTIEDVSTDPSVSQDCDGGGVTIGFTVADECSADRVTATAELDLDYVAASGFNTSRTLSGPEISALGGGGYEIVLDDIAPGQHAVRVRGFDGCGNTNGRVIPFTIEDNASVSPICAKELTFVLMPDGDGGGLAVVEADDYVIDVMGICGPATDVILSIYREEEEAGAPGFVPQPGRAEFLVDCSDEGDINVRVYTFAPNGQNEFCAVVATISQPNGQEICNDGDLGRGSLAGFITSPRNELLSGIEVHISDLDAMNEMMYTDENGSFLFTDLEMGGEYMIRPNMPDEVDLSRVKTSDIFKITNHILGTDYITNPHRLVAADVNADGIVNVGDMVAIRRVILGLDDSFPDGPTWRFIRRDFSLEGLEEGWDASIFPATFTVAELEGHNREADFVAIEVGDVYTEVIPRTTLALEAEDQLLTAGARTQLALTAGAMSGFQGTLEARPGLVIEGWTSTVLSENSLNDRALSRGGLALSYNDRVDLSGTEIITLQLRAEVDLRISDYLRLTDRITFPEALAPDGATAALSLEFTNAPGGMDFVLHQNFPNPVRAETTIEYDLPAAGAVTLEVRDVQGRLLTERVLSGSAGRNSITLHSDDLKNTTGILTYSLRMGQERITKRMTVVAR